MAEGRRGEALAWLDRAHRLAPRDALIALLLAGALAGLDDARARDLLADLVAERPWFRDARVALVAAERRLGDHGAAASTLDALLRRCAPPLDRSFAALADAVARDGDAPGWLGLDSTGSLFVSAPGSSPNLRLDGRALRLATGSSSRLPRGWREATRLDALLPDGQALLGSGMAPEGRLRAEGVVALDATGALSGWAWLPADPDRPAPLLVVGSPEGDGDGRAGAAVRIVAGLERDGSVDAGRGLHLPASRLPLGTVLHVRGPDGRALAGSPLYPEDEWRTARAAAAALRVPDVGSAPPPAPDSWRPLPVLPFVPRTGTVPLRRPVDVVIPVHAGVEDLRRCLGSLERDLPGQTRLVVVDDASPDPALRAELATLPARGIVVLHHSEGRGFPAAANTGLRHAAADGPRDVVLLNPDTLLPRGWLDRLAAAAYAAADIASVTPMTSDGTITSLSPAAILPIPAPDVGEKHTIDLARTDRLDALARAANGAGTVDLPTAVGFCMFLRGDALADVGLLRERPFAQGYGEENDWCLRARALGWRHVAATGVFVAHLGGRSFGAVKADLIARNLATLNRLHPGYDALVAAFRHADPLAPARARLDRRRWRQGRRAGAVVLVTHALGGGVARHLEERCRSLRAQGLRPVVLRPWDGGTAGETGGGCVVSDGMEEGFPDLGITLPSGLPALLALLRAERPRWVELHHLLGHEPEAVELAARLGVPYDVVVHDYALWCPRVTLCSYGGRYCGEPLDPRTCEDCVADLGGRLAAPSGAVIGATLGAALGVVEQRRRSAALLAGARHVITPCEDVEQRLLRQFPVLGGRDGLVVTPWEPPPDIPPAALRRRSPGTGDGSEPDGTKLRVLLCGAIGPEKGFDVLLGCAREAARAGRPIEFVVVGHSYDDARLIEAGVFVTGRFREGEATALLRRQGGALGFLPSVCPETWCYALSALWGAGLPVVAFDLGAQAERIRRSGRGAVLPLGLDAARINVALLAAGRRES